MKLSQMCRWLGLAIGVVLAALAGTMCDLPRVAVFLLGAVMGPVGMALGEEIGEQMDKDDE